MPESPIEPGPGDRLLSELTFAEAGARSGVLNARDGTPDNYLADYELAMGRLMGEAQAAASGERHWAPRIRVLLRTLLEGLAASPGLARACAMVELRDGSGRLASSCEGVVDRLSILLWPDTGDRGDRRGDELAARLLAEDVLDMIGRTVVDASPAALPSLLVQLHWWVVTFRAS